MSDIQLNAIQATHETEFLLRNKLQTLKDFQTNLTPKNDGLPRSQNFSSRVEKLTAEIIDVETELKNLLAEREELQFELFDKLKSCDLTPSELSVMIERYIYCRPFKTIIRDLNFSESTIFKLHRNGVKKFRKVK